MHPVVLLLIAVGLAAGPALTGIAIAQSGKKPPTKTAGPAKKPGVGPIVLGTTQLPGDFGKIGQTYTVGKNEPINLTLDSVRYAADRFVVAGSTTVPKADQKLLVLRYTIHNPLPREQRYYWASELPFHRRGRRRPELYVRAGGPAGGRRDRAVRPEPEAGAEGPVGDRDPGARGRGGAEADRPAGARRPGVPLRPARQGGPAPRPAHGSADASGATARADVPYKAGEAAALGNFDLTLESFAYTDEALNGRALQPGYRNAVATFTLKNAPGRDSRYYWGYFEAVGRDADGEKVPYNQTLLKGAQRVRGRRADARRGGAGPLLLLLRRAGERRGEGPLRPGRERR